MVTRMANFHTYGELNVQLSSRQHEKIHSSSCTILMEIEELSWRTTNPLLVGNNNIAIREEINLLDEKRMLTTFTNTTIKQTWSLGTTGVSNQENSK